MPEDMATLRPAICFKLSKRQALFAGPVAPLVECPLHARTWLELVRAYAVVQANLLEWLKIEMLVGLIVSFESQYYQFYQYYNMRQR